MEKVRLGDIFEYMPKSKIKAGEGKEQGKYKFFTSSNLQDKYIDEWVYSGEYLIFGTGGKASINYCNEKFSTSTDNFVVKVKKGINTKFVYFYFKNDMQKLENGFKGASIKHISKDYINKLTIPIYDFRFQEKIVKQLDKVQEIIDLRRKQMGKLDELIKSQFGKMFGDVVTNSKKMNCTRLGLISIIKSGGTPTRNNPDFFKGNIPWITTVSLGKDTINEKDAVEFITKEAVDKSATKIISKNSLLFGIRVGVGKISMNTVDMCTNQDVVAITNIDKRWRVLFLEKVIESYSNYFNNQKRGATIKGITSELLKKIKIPIVEVEVQDKFINFLNLINKKRYKLEKSLNKMENLQASLMNKYFGG